MLHQLREPGQTPLPHEPQKAPAIGIDLGTTHSLVAIVQEGQPRILKDESGQSLLPSVIHRGAHSLSSFKRFMQSDKSTKSLHTFTVEDESITVIEASAEILTILKTRAEKDLACTVTQAVITVPAYFDDGARTATRAAARLAGLEVLRLVNEPTAAALAYGLEHRNQGVYGVYDLGGGTFDFSVLRLEGHFFKVLATGGDTQLGGDDMDDLILSHFNVSTSLSGPDVEVRRQARQVKEYLTDHLEWTGPLRDQSVCCLTRTTFNDLIDPLIQRTLTVCRQVMRDAACSLDQLQGLVLVGGATRIPFLRQQIKYFFQQDPLINLNPDEIVALGAALQAQALSEPGSAHLLLDVNPLSLGLETYGGLVEKIIPRNSPLPGRQSQEFTTFQDNQTVIHFHVVQGERELAQDCRSLAQFELKDICPLPAGHARVKVTFLVDADGILTVSARDQTTGQEQSVDVKSTFGLTEEVLQQMIDKSHIHAHEDEEKKKSQTAKVEQARLTQLVHRLFSEPDRGE